MAALMESVGWTKVATDVGEYYYSNTEVCAQREPPLYEILLLSPSLHSDMSYTRHQIFKAYLNTILLCFEIKRCRCELRTDCVAEYESGSDLRHPNSFHLTNFSNYRYHERLAEYGGDEEAKSLLVQAYTTLTDPVARAAFDQRTYFLHLNPSYTS